MKNILVVDDEKIVLDVLQRFISRLGFNTVVTDSWESALIIFSKENYDLVLMDVLMPGKNGFEVAEEMRQMRPDQKIVMLSGFGNDAPSVQDEPEGTDLHYILSKPLSFEGIKSVLTMVFGETMDVAGEL